MKPGSPQYYIDRGYRRISARHGTISRIDRPDWKTHMIPSSDGHARLASFIEHDGSSEDFYRRYVSTDILGVGNTVAAEIPDSTWDTTGFIEEKKT